jgi:hypothetical protein
MKVPTYHKFGLTKTQLKEVETRDKMISDVLTHHLTIGIGLALGVVVYIIYYNEVRPSTFIQVTMQIFLFASMGVLCVGVPAVIFKLAEMYYFKRKENTDEHKTIKAYTEERDEFDFWKLRKDFSFWRILDGLSFEKEVMNLYMHLGYELKDDMFSEKNPNDRIIHKDNKNYYLSFYTKLLEISDTSVVDELLKRMEKHNCDELLIFSQVGFNKKLQIHVKEQEKEHTVQLLDINGIIKVVRTVKK